MRGRAIDKDGQRTITETLIAPHNLCLDNAQCRNSQNVQHTAACSGIPRFKRGVKVAY